jgi:hypothetical protein
MTFIGGRWQLRWTGSVCEKDGVASTSEREEAT